MNGVDVVLVIIFLIAIYGGYRKGFIFSSLDLVNWIGSIFLGFLFYPYTAKLFEKILPSLGAWLLPVAFLLTIIVARLLIGLVTKRIAWLTTQRANDSRVNKILGIFPGAVTGFIYATIVAALLLSLPLWDEVTSSTQNSRIANKLTMQVEWLNHKLSPVFDKAIRQTINNLTIHPDSDELVKLPFKTTRVKPRPDLEARMLELVNQERIKNVLHPLKADSELTIVARAHSHDMFARGYFAHVSPDGKSPFDRMKQANIQFLTAGENLALAHSLEIAHDGLMNSPGHRANILNPSYSRLGIGILDGSFHGLMVSQEFRN
ncbi:MAG: hypothetical protein C4308_03315 [Chitinophagaceae bacterium]